MCFEIDIGENGGAEVNCSYISVENVKDSGARVDCSFISGEN
ncbi:hypothetical protein [Cytobacillus kochii]|nr:hypothetical protein [Cytobacillus kochii]